MDAYEIKNLKTQIGQLSMEHRDLDDIIQAFSERVPVDMIQLQRLKKRKLALKDQIARLENRLIPDIIA